MDNRVFSEKVTNDLYQKIARGVSLKTAQSLERTDPILFQIRLREMCKSVLYEWEKDQALKYTIDDDRFVVSTEAHEVIYMYIHSLYEHARYLSRLNCSSNGEAAPLVNLCWLPNGVAPITTLCTDAWYHIASYLEVEDLRSISVVSRSLHALFKDNVFWRTHVLQLQNRLKLNEPMYPMLSYKQQVLRYLLYVSEEEAFKRALFTPMGELLASCMILGLFTLTPKGTNNKRRKTQELRVRTETGAEVAHLAIGYKEPNDCVRATIWIDSMWRLRFASVKCARETWCFIQHELRRFRRLVK